MQIDGHDIGICSWSPDVGELVEIVRQLGLSHAQINLGSIMFLDDKRKHQQLTELRTSGIAITGGVAGFPGEDWATIARLRPTGGFVPDAPWPMRKQVVIEAGKLAQEMKLPLISTHFGFIPPSNHEGYAKLVERVGELGQALAELGVLLLAETGQERASELLQFLHDVPSRNVGVNFDPANIILYGSGDPIEAIGILGKHIRHVHIKDGIPSDHPGADWGKEVPFGFGDVGPRRFLEALRQVGYTGPMVFEREGGPSRVADVRAGIEILRAAADELPRELPR